MCLGVWTAPFVNQHLGSWWRNQCSLVPTYPVAGYSLSIQTPTTNNSPLDHVIYDQSNEFYCTSLPPVLRVASFAEFRGFEQSPNDACELALRQRAAQLFPQANDAIFGATVWRGLRPQCPDDVPLCGKTRLPNVLMSCVVIVRLCFIC